MTANNTPKSRGPTPQEATLELPATESPVEEIFRTGEPGKTTTSSFDLTELGLSAKPDHSRLTTMGRFLTDEGIGRMEKLIHPLVQAKPQSTMEGAVESSSSNRKTSSVVVEVGSVCSVDTYRIVRDFGKK